MFVNRCLPTGKLMLLTPIYYAHTAQSQNWTTRIEKRNPHPKSQTTALQKPHVQFIFYFLYIHIMVFFVLLFQSNQQKFFANMKQNTTTDRF
jgi:hypothetical protein